MFQGTYKANRRPVVTTAPDCLVYINGELSLPSGSNPNRRVDLQPMLVSVSVNVGTQGGSGSASLELHIPEHYLDDIYVGGKLTLTTMMEVQIYMKGHFTVGGAPQFYPVFWGIVTSVNESYSAGEHTVSLSCSDILYWWEIQQIAHNPSWMASRDDQQQRFNLEGSVFTRKNPFAVLYSLARNVYGDSMNMRNLSLTGQDERSEPSPEENRRLMAYWSLRWGRIANSLRMYGPTGEVLQGDALDFAINPRKFLKGKRGQAAKNEGTFFDAFKQGDIDFANITPFALVFSKMQSMEMTNSEFETKLNVANQVKEAIGYEFFMDVTGELIFKPPFYNMDVRPNYPVSWIRDLDVISWNFAENPPDATFVEATGFRFRGQQVGMGDEIQPKATYVDYRLVQKFGWKPGSFSSEFVGGDAYGGPKALFYYLVDVLDRQNSRVNNGTVTIPLRPELRLGYPVYVEGRDAYYYIESLTHTFSYGSRCTTQATLMARRQKFYGDFGRWETENQEPQPGDIADPGTVPQNMYKRNIDPVSGTPEGDRNVILTYFPEKALDEYGKVETFEDQAAKADDTEVLMRNLVNLRSQFGTNGPNKYMYMVDPNRDTPHDSDDNGKRNRGPLMHIEADPKIDIDEEGRKIEVNATTFPVSDERGYEVVGTYEYGRRVSLNSKGFIFDKQEDDIRAEGLLSMEPDHQRGGTTTPNQSEDRSNQAASAHKVDPSKDKNFMVDPNNYGRMLTEVRPPSLGAADLAGMAQTEAARLADAFKGSVGPGTPSGDTGTSSNWEGYNGEQPGVTRTPTTAQSKWGRTFAYNSNVGRWRGTIRSVRERLGYSEETYPDEVILAFIHTESAGDASARRTNVDKDGNESLSQFVGLLQIGKDNAADHGRKNTDFMGNPELSIQHFLEYQDEYKDRHNGDPRKQAILWKGGPGTLKAYNRQEAAGQTDQQLEHWLANYPPGKTKINKAGEEVAVNWGVDEYASRVKAASRVWNTALEKEPAGPTEEETEDASAAGGSAADSVAAQAANLIDEANDPVASKRINRVGLPSEENEARVQLELFGQRLQENRSQGINALPSDLKPPRDPSVIPVVTTFLRDLYQSAFQKGKTREAELRGETKQVPRVPDAASIPTSTPSEKEFVDSPLSRKEVKDALDSGETVSSLFREDGAVEQLREKFRNSKNTAEQSIEDAGSALSNLTPNPTTDDDE